MGDSADQPTAAAQQLASSVLQVTTLVASQQQSLEHLVNATIQLQQGQGTLASHLAAIDAQLSSGQVKVTASGANINAAIDYNDLRKAIRGGQILRFDTFDPKNRFDWLRVSPDA